MGKTQDNKGWKFKKSGDYYTDLAMKESTNNPASVNELRYIGLYQMGEMALVDAGYYKKDRKPGQKAGKQFNNDWTGKNGIYTREEFLANREVQDIAVREYHKIIWERYLQPFHLYQGVELGGVKLTKAGMISCAHLVGQGSMKDFIQSKGSINKDDKNKQTCADYLKGFMDYFIDYSTEKHMNKLRDSHKEPQPVSAKETPNSPSLTSSELTKARNCLGLLSKFQQLNDEFRHSMNHARTSEKEKIRPQHKIKQDITLLSDALRKYGCKQEETEFYNKIVKTINLQEARGNSK